LLNLRQKQWLLEKISTLPYLFSGVGLAGIDSRREEGKLVNNYNHAGVECLEQI